MSRAASGQSRRVRRGTLTLGWNLLRIFLVFVLMMMLLEKSLIFFPTSDGDWQPAGLAFEDAWFEADDGTKLHGWLLEHDQPRAHLLFMHGNAGNLTHRAHVVERLRQELNATVMIFDYRGYGRSEGSPDEAGILADARAARAWLADRAGIEQQDVVLMGRSLGGGVAVDLAANDGCRALILENTFTSLPDVAAHHYPFLPVRTLMRTRLDSLRKIATYDGPLIQSHGTSDEVIPFELGRRLFEAAPGKVKRFIPLQGLQHNDGHPASYYARLSEFLDKLQAES